jgi:hypothetical protein
MGTRRQGGCSNSLNLASALRYAQDLELAFSRIVLGIIILKIGLNFSPMDLDPESVPDLTGQVTRYDLPALIGGYANVYQGEWKGKHVNYRLIQCFGVLTFCR